MHKNAARRLEASHQKAYLLEHYVPVDLLRKASCEHEWQLDKTPTSSGLGVDPKTAFIFKLINTEMGTCQSSTQGVASAPSAFRLEAKIVPNAAKLKLRAWRTPCRVTQGIETFHTEP